MRLKARGSGCLRGVVLSALAAGTTEAQTRPPSPPPVSYEAPADAPYRAENVLIHSPYGHSLGATLTVPCELPGPLPTVVLISGTGAQNRDAATPGGPYRPFRELADALSRRGIAVLRFDDRGVTAGNYFAIAGAHEVAEDVRAALMLVRSRERLDPSRIALLGHSEGGLVATMVAAADPSLRAIVLLGSPALRPAEGVRAQLRYAVARDTTLRTPAARDSALRGRLAAAERQFATAWFKPTADYDPLMAAHAVRRPSVLVLQGSTDWQVQPEQAPALAEAFRRGGNRDVSLKLFPGVNHLFLPDAYGDPDGYFSLPSQDLSREVVGTIADWLSARLKVPPAARGAGPRPCR